MHFGSGIERKAKRSSALYRGEGVGYINVVQHYVTHNYYLFKFKHEVPMTLICIKTDSIKFKLTYII